MKFSCDKCNTRYSIADERVRGRVLKIRCKACNHVITVREPDPLPSEPHAVSDEHTVVSTGPLSTAAPPSTEAPDEWYVSFDGDQEGPLPLQRARDRVRTPSGHGAKRRTLGVPASSSGCPSRTSPSSPRRCRRGRRRRRRPRCPPMVATPRRARW
jgi:predicted Zn finger-like uncharacterized protein